MIHTTEASQAMLIQESLSAAWEIFRECGQHGAAEMTRRYLRMLIINGIEYSTDGTAIISPEIRNANRQLAERALRLRSVR